MDDTPDAALARSHALGDIPRRTAGRVPDRLALVDGDVRLTFAELDAAVDGIAAAMQDAGLRKGDVLALLSRNCWQAAVLPFAAARAGVILAPMNFLLGPQEVAGLVRLVRPAAFVAEEHLVETADHALALAGHVPAVRLAIEPGPRAERLGWADAAAWTSHRGTPDPVAVADTDVVRHMFTSGTEALPKAVALTSRSILWQQVSAAVDGGMSGEDVDLHVMPLYHCAQLDVFLGPDVYLGATSVILRSAGAGAILRAVAEHGVTKLFATPSKWIELLRSPGFDPAALSTVTKGYYGAAPMPVAVLRELADRLPGLRLWNFYGQTEMSPCATILPPEDQLAHAGSAGRPALNVELAILDDDSRPLADGEVGEIAFRSPHACLGYVGDPAATARLFAGGWLHTGDRGVRTPDGRLSFVDRVKDTVNVGGEKVASREVEEAIYALDGVQEAAVFSVPDARRHELVVAAVVAQEGRTLDPADVRAHVRRTLAGFKTPAHVLVVDSLPKSASGKVLKRELRERHAGIGRGGEV